MSKRISLLLSVLLFLVFTSCNQPQKPSSDLPALSSKIDEDEDDDQDGIREAQEMEFDLTKDIKLGYIPRYRLVEAIEAEMIKSRSGYANRISALTWIDRGPNSDVVGPSNGNTRGTGPASDAVTSGRIRAIWYDLADLTNRTVWVGSVSGGIWKTNDITSKSAAAWSVVNDFLGNLAIAAICQDPSNTDILYFGTGEKTNNADRVQGGGVWKSIDHGVTWNLLTNTVNFTNVSQMTCDAAGNVYVSTIGTNGIQRSTNGGTTWTNITPTGLTSNVTEMKLSSTGRLHISCGYSNSGVSGYRFTDSPESVTAGTWTVPNTSFPTAFNAEIAVAGNTLYALPSDVNNLTPTIYKSIDGGNNWAPTSTSPPGTTAEPSINTGQGWFDLAIGVDPANPNNVIAGGLNFYKSTDGGVNWTQLSRWVGTTLMYVHADHHNVTWKGSQVLLGTDGGIFYSDDNGVTFTDRNDGLSLKQFYSCAIHPTTTNYFLGGAQDNGTHQLTSPGLGSSIEVHGGDGAYVHIDQDEPQYQFSATTRSQYRRSTNGGSTWSSSIIYSSTVGQFINPTDYDDAANIMYTSGNTGQYVRWENPQTGSTFTPVTIAAFNNASTRSINVSPYTPNRVFFGTFGGRIVKVDNAHTNTPTATNITGTGMSTTNVSCVAIGTNDDNLLATFSNYGSIHVWVTSTGGGTAGWTNISGTGLPDIPVRWAMFYPEDNTKALLATEMGVYETDQINGASTVWVRNSSFPTVKTNMLQYRRSDGTVLAATHGRGLWTAQLPVMPYVRFASNLNSKSEGAYFYTSGCRRYADYTVNLIIDQAPAGDANITLSLAGGATATQGVDFDFTTNGDFNSPSSSLTFANGATTPQPVIIRIYDDAAIEGSENFTLTFSINGTTNALVAPSGSSYTFTITDNDVAPVAPAVGPVTAGTGSYGAYIQPFRSNFNNARSQYIYLASELAAFGLNPGNIVSAGFNVTSKTSTQPYSDFTIAIKPTSNNTFTASTFETGTTPVYSQNYSTVTGINTFNFSSPFNWDGTSNILVEICFSNASATGTGDNVSSSITPDLRGLWNRDNATPNCLLTGSFASVGSDYVRPDIIFTGNKNNPVASSLGVSQTEYVASTNIVNFFNGNNIIAQLSNASANLDCVTTSIFETGNTWQAFEAGTRSGKVIEIEPTNNSGASYTVRLYVTAAELDGRTPSSLKIAKTTAPNMNAANTNNTVMANATVTAYGTGYMFSANFTGFSKFFLVDNAVVLPVDLLSFNGHLNNNGFSDLLWKTTNQVNLKNFEVQRSYDAVQFSTVGSVNALQNPATIQQYNYTDQLKAKAVNFYRLKMVDVDGRFKYSGIVKVTNNTPGKFVEILQNPVRSNISFMIENAKKHVVFVTLYTSGGQQVKQWNLGKQEGAILLPIENVGLSSGVYIMKIKAGDRTASFRVTKQ